MTAAVLLALPPIIVLIALGALLRHRRILDEGFSPQLGRLSHPVPLPSLFHGLATAHLEALSVGGPTLTLILSTMAAAALIVALPPLLRRDGPAFTSALQGSIRFSNDLG